MFLKIAMLAALGVGNYFGPTNLGVPTNAFSFPEIPFQAPLSDDDLRDAFRRLWRIEHPSQIQDGVGPAASNI